MKYVDLQFHWSLCTFKLIYAVECTVGVVGVTCVCTGAYNISSVGLFDACLCGKQTASGHLGRYGR